MKIDVSAKDLAVVGTLVASTLVSLTICAVGAGWIAGRVGGGQACIVMLVCALTVVRLLATRAGRRRPESRQLADSPRSSKRDVTR